MGCKVTFLLGRNTITYESKYTKEEDLTIEKIADEILHDHPEYLLNDKEGKEGDTILIALQSLLKKDKKSKNTVLDNIKKFISGETESLVGNYTLKDLTNKFPNLHFNNEDFENLLEANEEIIYSPNLKCDGLGLSGEATINGRIYHILSSYYDVKEFLFNLNIRKKLKEFEKNEDVFNKYIEENENIKSSVEYIKKKKNIKNNLTAIKYFFQHSDEFTYVFTNDDVDIYTTLSDYFTRLIYDRAGKKQLNNLLINSIYQRTWISNNKYIISKKDVIKICESVLELHKDDKENPLYLQSIYLIDSLSQKFKTDNKESDKENQKLLDTQIAEYLLNLFDLEDYHLDIIINGGLIYFSKPFMSFEDVFGFKTNELKLVRKLESKFGFNIFEYKNKYYVSKDNIITLGSYAGNKYNTIEEARKYIENKLKQPVFKQFQLEKYNLNLEKFDYFSPKQNTSFDVYDYKIPYNSGNILDMFSEEDKKNYLYVSINEALNNLLKKYNIDFSNIITDYDKLIILLLELNNNSVNDAILKIRQLKSKKYLVLYNQKYYTRFNDKVKVLYKLKLEDVTPGFTSNDPENTGKQIPIITYLKNLAATINSKFLSNHPGIDPNSKIIEIITDSDLENDETVNKHAKGFIRNGIIYINASRAGLNDLSHEFAHLFLGMLKARDMNKYLNLLSKAVSNDKIQREIIKLRNNDEYKYLSEIDITEEAFVKLFGEHILHSSLKLSVLENEININFEDALKQIGSDLTTVNRLNDLFDSFNISMCSVLTQGNGLELDASAARNRRITNMIKQKISEGKITENCK